MRLLIAPDKFKGSLTALAAAQAIERGFRSVFPDLKADLAPIADGGEGFAESLGAALGAEWITVQSEDALERAVEARYAWVADQKLAVIEMSQASGLWRLASDERDPHQAHTAGTGSEVFWTSGPIQGIEPLLSELWAPQARLQRLPDFHGRQDFNATP